MTETLDDVVGELQRLGADADERAIKRAYAKALKVIRPDEDAAAFQALHDAYQRALAARRSQVESADESAAFAQTVAANDASQSAAPVVAAQPRIRSVDVALPPQPDPRHALASMLREGSTAVPAQLPAWLRAHSQDWSFDTRDAVALRFLHALREDDVLVCESNVLAMYNLLGWNDIASGVDARELQWLAERTHRAWLQLPAQHDGLAILVAGPGPNRPSAGAIATRLKALQTPRSRLRNLWSALRPDRAKAVVALMGALGCQPGVPLPKGIDSGQANFWGGQAQPWHRLELQVWLFRAAVLSTVLVGVLFPAMWFDGYASLLTGSPLRTGLLVMTAWLLPPALVLGRFGRHALYAWQLAPESVRSARENLRIAGVPLLVGIVVVLVLSTYRFFLDWIPLYILAVWLLTWQVVRIAQFRYYARRNARPPEHGSGLFFMVVGTALFVPALVTSIVFWALDLRRARAMRWWNE